MTTAATLPRVRRHTARSLAQQKRAERAKDRRGGLGPLDLPGARAQVAAIRRVLPRWVSHDHWLEIVEAFLETDEADVLRKQCGGVSAAVVRAEAYNLARWADGGGFTVAESKDVAAENLGRCTEQVKRARRFLRRAGLVVRVFAGTELSYPQRVDADRARGPRQGRKFTGQRGLTDAYMLGYFTPESRAKLSTPKEGEFAQLIENVPLPSVGGRTAEIWRQIDITLQAAGAARTTARPPAALRRRKGRPAAAFTAAVLANPLLDPLFAGVTVSQFVAQLTPYHRGGWKPNDLARMIHREALRRDVNTTHRAWRPPGLLKTLLATISLVDDGPLVPAARPLECAACVGGWRKDEGGGWWECDHSPVDQGVLF